jgi:hypothetical protein
VDQESRHQDSYSDTPRRPLVVDDSASAQKVSASGVSVTRSWIAVVSASLLRTQRQLDTHLDLAITPEPHICTPPDTLASDTLAEGS